jgi:lipopolysaccharide/colanic/teichoic acid biosynthesis glycosyltransferase
MDIIRIFDVVLVIVGLLVLAPILICIAIIIKLTSSGSIFYKQVRVGKGGKDFKLFKFRSMRPNADKAGLLTIGGKDNRITPIGYFLRKYKLDELPQLINVLKGEMSLVGPRPEVRKYVELYNSRQKEVLSVLPGITDYASIVFRNENELLAQAGDPEAFYISQVMPKKIELNFAYIRHRNIKQYFNVIAKTIVTSISGK